uniref:RRM domain-containing protein n=1 Tax=Taenia asiatica TaxID=60517 RepID=A0A0R3VYX7_TAEAS
MDEHSRLRLLLKNVNVNAKISEIKRFFSPVRVKDAKILKRGTSTNYLRTGMRCLGIAVVYFKSKKDLDISLQKRGVIHGTEITVAPYEDELFIDTPKTDVSKPVWETVPVEELRSEIKEVGFVPPYIFTGRLFVRNLAYDCTEAELLELFSSFGTVSEIHLSFDRKLQRSKGFAFVTYLFPDEAVAAFNKLDKYKFKVVYFTQHQSNSNCLFLLQSRLLHILPGKPREVDDAKGNGGDEKVVEGEYEREVDRAIMSEFQKKRHAELKSMASVSHNWNTLFVNADAVATYLSAKFGVSKRLTKPSSWYEEISALLLRESRNDAQNTTLRLCLVLLISFQ